MERKKLFCASEHLIEYSPSGFIQPTTKRRKALDEEMELIQPLGCGKSKHFVLF